MTTTAHAFELNSATPFARADRPSLIRLREKFKREKFKREKMDGDLNSIIRKYVPAKGYEKIHWSRNEHGMGGTEGTPDLNGCCNSVECWLELKRVIGWRVKMRPLQISWVEQRALCGGRVFIACHKPGYGFWLLRPMAARLLVNNAITAVPHELVAVKSLGEPKNWPWSAIRTCVFGP